MIMLSGKQRQNRESRGMQSLKLQDANKNAKYNFCDDVSNSIISSLLCEYLKVRGKFLTSKSSQFCEKLGHHC